MIIKYIIIFVLTISVFNISCKKNNLFEDEVIKSDSEYRFEIDDLNRRVKIPSQPERILALSRSFIEDLFEIGITPVGKVEEYDNREEGIALPSVSTQRSPDIEAIIQLQPDFIIANVRQHANIIDYLELSGAPVFFVDPNKVEVDAMTDRITLLGKLFNREKIADDYINNLNELSNELKSKIKVAGYKTGIMIQGGVESILAAQPTGFNGALFTRLGIENIVPSDLSGARQSTWVNYDIETILQNDPDIILVRAADGSHADYDAMLNYYLNNQHWKELSAVQNGNIFVLSSDINVGSISNIDALKNIAEIILSNK